MRCDTLEEKRTGNALMSAMRIFFTKREQIADMKIFFSKIKRRPWEKILQEAASMREGTGLGTRGRLGQVERDLPQLVEDADDPRPLLHRHHTGNDAHMEPPLRRGVVHRALRRAPVVEDGQIGHLQTLQDVTHPLLEERVRHIPLSAEAEDDLEDDPVPVRPRAQLDTLAPVCARVGVAQQGPKVHLRDVGELPLEVVALGRERGTKRPEGVGKYRHPRTSPLPHTRSRHLRCTSCTQLLDTLRRTSVHPRCSEEALSRLDEPLIRQDKGEHERLWGRQRLLRDQVASTEALHDPTPRQVGEELLTELPSRRPRSTVARIGELGHELDQLFTPAAPLCLEVKPRRQRSGGVRLLQFFEGLEDVVVGRLLSRIRAHRVHPSAPITGLFSLLKNIAFSEGIPEKVPHGIKYPLFCQSLLYNQTPP